MNTLQEFKSQNIYEIADLIDNSAKAGVEFWNYNEKYFVDASTKFSKETLLHMYIAITAMNYYRRDFRKNGDCECDESMEKWYSLFSLYGIKIPKFNFEKSEDIYVWFEKHNRKFQRLFDLMSEEVFYILFANRQFLLNFNTITSNTVQETVYSKKNLSRKGTIKRVGIPTWVQKAVFHRDKGRCIFCFTDLTNLINTLTSSNYDHIVPLDLYGTNDPCNIQLTCEKCNKTKARKGGTTSNIYIPWWS